MQMIVMTPIYARPVYGQFHCLYNGFVNPLARMCLCEDISSEDQECSNKKLRRSPGEQNRTPSSTKAQWFSTSVVQGLSIFCPPGIHLLNFLGDIARPVLRTAIASCPQHRHAAPQSWPPAFGVASTHAGCML